MTFHTIIFYGNISSFYGIYHILQNVFAVEVQGFFFFLADVIYCDCGDVWLQKLKMCRWTSSWESKENLSCVSWDYANGY